MLHFYATEERTPEYGNVLIKPPLDYFIVFKYAVLSAAEKEDRVKYFRASWSICTQTLFSYLAQ